MRMQRSADVSNTPHGKDRIHTWSAVFQLCLRAPNSFLHGHILKSKKMTAHFLKFSAIHRGIVIEKMPHYMSMFLQAPCPDLEREISNTVFPGPLYSLGHSTTP